MYNVVMLLIRFLASLYIHTCPALWMLAISIVKTVTVPCNNVILIQAIHLQHYFCLLQNRDHHLFSDVADLSLLGGKLIYSFDCPFSSEGYELLIAIRDLLLIHQAHKVSVTREHNQLFGNPQMCYWSIQYSILQLIVQSNDFL